VRVFRVFVGCTCVCLLGMCVGCVSVGVLAVFVSECCVYVWRC
jgi:hypothetical protein